MNNSNEVVLLNFEKTYRLKIQMNMFTKKVLGL